MIPVQISARLGSSLNLPPMTRNGLSTGIVPSCAMAWSIRGDTTRHCIACASEAIMTPICVTIGRGQTISVMTYNESELPALASRRRASRRTPKYASSNTSTKSPPGAGAKARLSSDKLGHTSARVVPSGYRPWDPGHRSLRVVDPHVRYWRGATDAQSMKKLVYTTRLVTTAAMVPRGIAFVGSFSDIDRFAPLRKPVKQGKKSVSMVANDCSVL
mmetsp:Transcript_4819/g.11922  ORF Transcript_4819/g.11922 Transcript_4819/m.11922 type:complete len:216 (+) Transcript_4819:712-1359(+)